MKDLSRSDSFQKMEKRIFVILSVVFIIFTLNLFCSKDGVLDEPEKSYEPGRRDYTWEWDTFLFPEIMEAKGMVYYLKKTISSSIGIEMRGKTLCCMENLKNKGVYRYIN